MPDMVGVGEVQECGFGSDGGHQAPTTGDGKMDAAALSLEATYELVNSVERTVSAHFVSDVVEWLII